jgi:putative ABC transport system substrate-binding protein
MRRREFIGLSGAALVASPCSTRAQEAGRHYRLGILGLQEGPAAMLDSLRRSGFVEGRNLTVDSRAYERQVGRTLELASELVRANPDVLFGVGEEAIQALLRATATIPIVGSAEDMVGSGLTDSLSRPTGNLTGISILSAELDNKRQEILCDALPGLKRIAALADTRTTAESRLPGLQAAMQRRGVALALYPVTKSEEIAPAIDAAKGAGAGALNVLASPILYSFRKIVMARAAELRLPAIYQWPEMVAEGGFAGYGPRLLDIYGELLPSRIVKVLRGAKPADIPIEQPTKFALALNLKTAKELDVTIPMEVVARADDVIE